MSRSIDRFIERKQSQAEADAKHRRKHLEARALAAMDKMERSELFCEIVRAKPDTARLHEWLLESLEDKQLEEFLEAWEQE